MEEKEFNLFIYAFKMLVCSCVWVIAVICILYNYPDFPHKSLIFNFGQDSFGVELSNLIAFLLAFFVQNLLLTKIVYPYTFSTNCKNPVICLFINIAFGWFIVLSSSENIAYEGFDTIFIPRLFVVMAIMNYLLFYAKNGHEYREREMIDNWNKAVYGPSESKKSK